jgi:hypothetical protein
MWYTEYLCVDIYQRCVSCRGQAEWNTKWVEHEEQNRIDVIFGIGPQREKFGKLNILNQRQ